MSALFAALDATWPAAETRERAGWLLRRGAGGGRRVSSATALHPDADIADAEAGLAAWGQSPVFRISGAETALDAALEARGYAVEAPSVLFSTPAASLLDDRPETARVVRGSGRVALMEEIWAAGGIGPARLAVMDRAAPPKAFMLARLGDRPAAVAFIAAAGGVAMIHAVETLPEHRRKGAARMLLAAAARFAVETGAETLALAVEAKNERAIPLYLSLGMGERARYHYRVKPG
ncbi:MAG: GNAT family N-acetyltransferase [Pikeienuella sp.]|uniref:GNAT family N-acetyltransferase n=1 Tax=Pikeienuella sp. TaxID=2831957 RepID=UPI00391A628E